MKKKNILKKYKGYLVKRITIENIIVLITTLATITLALIGVAVIVKNNKRYIYNDGENGISNKCEIREDGTYCSKMVKVNWFMEE